ncbi:MAG: hypothetical protein D6736_08740 [Nitrospinota bacterium]|nr:MAG: hypothetical protein D6736_08740 [Nitrospinota bacterium]
MRRTGMAFVLTAALVSFTILSLGFAAEKLPIGALAPLSPPGAHIQGKELIDGVQLAVEDINKAGGLLGKQIELFVEDTQGRPEVGATAVEKLIDKRGVVGITGEYHSSVCTAEIEVVHRRNVPFVIGSCWFDGLTEKGYPQVFRTSMFNSRLAEMIALLIQKQGFKNVSALVEDTDYGIGVGKNITAAIKRLQIDANFAYEVVERTTPHFVPILLKYRTAKPKPDLLITAVTQPGFFLLVKQAYEIGLTPTKDTLLLDATCTAQRYTEFWPAVKRGGNYILFACPYSPSVKLTKLGEAVKARFQQKFNREPTYVVIQGYDGMLALAKGIEKAGSTDPDAIIKALEGLQILGTRGTITFSMEKNLYYHQWKEVPAFIFQYTKMNQEPKDAATILPDEFATANLAHP